jgi:hypothetical protein
MIRLHVIAEGLTEASFVSQVLRPHLESLAPGAATVSAPKLGGHYTYARLRRFTKGLLGAPGAEVVVTTMIDLFKVAGDFPGLSGLENAALPHDRVRRLEEHCREDIGDRRFFPYLQLHEFEALLLSDLAALAEQRPNRRREILELADRLDREFESPEHVNKLQPPSYRIQAVVPEYQKVTDGVVTLERIGLQRLRERCRHFGEWLYRLEGVVAR